MLERIKRLWQFAEQNDCDCIVISSGDSIRYFSGFTSVDADLLISAGERQLFTDFRYLEQAADQTAGFKVIDCKKPLLEELAAAVLAAGFKRIAFEDSISFAEYQKLQTALKGSCTLKGVDLTALREIKEPSELAAIREAVAIADRAYTNILKFSQVGMTELELAAELEYFMKKDGSERPAFATIVASGSRGSLPHGVPTDRVISSGDLVTLDFGAIYQGYRSDITRTFCMGKADAEQRKVYNTVLQAQLLGLDSLRPGLSGVEVDMKVRKFIADAGYGKYFGHGLGHGVGLAIHELPRLSPSSPTKCLRSGMIVTVEPGIYIPGWGGIRIEDTVLLTPEGIEVLTQSDKKLLEI